MKLYPAVKKIWLQFTAGLMWSGVGIMLFAISTRWLRVMSSLLAFSTILAGAVSAAIIYRFGFSRMAIKNVHRIQGYPQERVCLFAFQKWTSYPLILFMVSLGIYLRLYSSLPKPLLAILYIGIGGGLFLSSIHYYIQVRRLHVVQPQL